MEECTRLGRILLQARVRAKTSNGVAENLAYMKRILIETKCCQVVTEEVVMESFIPVAVF
jgi:hypothetical protein